MNLCIPINEDVGLSSQIAQHFGSASAYMLVDTETNSYRLIANRTKHHAHGMCLPLASLKGQPIDAVVVMGIGRGALSKLNDASLTVYLATQPTVITAVDAFKANTLTPVTAKMACAHHRHHSARSV